MTVVKIQAPAGEGWLVPDGTPVTGEILDDSVASVARFTVTTSGSREIDLEPGRYFARVRLPDGELVTTSFHADGDETQLTLPSSPKANALSVIRDRLAAAVGGPRADEIIDLANLASQSMISSAASGQFSLGSLAKSLAHSGVLEHPLVADVAEAMLRSTVIQGRPVLGDLERWITAAATGDAATADVVRTSSPWEGGPPTELAELHVRLWQLGSSRWRPIEEKGVLARVGRWHARIEPDPGRIHAFQLGGPGLATRFVLLPINTPIEVRVRIRPSATELDADLAVEVATANPWADSLARYLTSGSVEATTMLVAPHTAFQAIDRESADGNAASVMGYALLQSGSDRLEEWGPALVEKWAAAFVERFPWLPDASVIQAWALINRGGVTKARLARRRLVEAAGNGIPVYTMGLERLLDGLELCDLDDQEKRSSTKRPATTRAKSMLSRVRPYVAAADSQQLLTTFYGPSPDEPRLEPAIGEIHEALAV
jgi:hypothetical protein